MCDRIGRTWEHSRIRSKSKDSGGASVCEHNRIGSKYLSLSNKLSLVLSLSLSLAHKHTRTHTHTRMQMHAHAQTESDIQTLTTSASFLSAAAATAAAASLTTHYSYYSFRTKLSFRFGGLITLFHYSYYAQSDIV